MVRASLLLCGLAVLLSGCIPDILNTKPEVKGVVADPGNRTLSDPAEVSTVDLSVGDTLRVRLNGNPSTGYLWKLVNSWDSTVFSLVAEDYESDPNPEKMVGVGGSFVFEFSALKPGELTVDFGHARPGADPVETKTVTIAISE